MEVIFRNGDWAVLPTSKGYLLCRYCIENNIYVSFSPSVSDKDAVLTTDIRDYGEYKKGFLDKID